MNDGTHRTGKPSHIELRTSPHVREEDDVIRIMSTVVLALMPIVAFSVWQFGLSALALVATATLVCVVTERWFDWMSDRPSSLSDWSAVITGLLLALTLPPGFPLWMTAVAAFVSIALGKALFGGLGMNLFNPALVGRAFVQAAFPAAITSWTPVGLEARFSSFIPTTWTAPFMSPSAVDAFTGATPLSLLKFEQVITPTRDLVSGATAGSTGETSALLVLVCGLWLVWRRIVDWRIPAAVLGGAVLASGLLFLLDPGRHPTPLFTLLTGGLMLGAWFMASDMVGSPVTPLGVVIYGLLIGVITVVIRAFGGLAEGVMYAVLLGNAATPLIDQWTQPRVFGQGRGGTKP